MKRVAAAEGENDELVTELERLHGDLKQLQEERMDTSTRQVAEAMDALKSEQVGWG